MVTTLLQPIKKISPLHDFHFLTEGITTLPEKITFKIRHTPEYHQQLLNSCRTVGVLFTLPKISMALPLDNSVLSMMNSTIAALVLEK